MKYSSLQRDLFELQRDVEQRVLARDLEHLVGRLLDDRGPRVVVLVDAVAEAHAAGPCPPSRSSMNAGDVVDRADLGEHADDLLVGAAVEGAVERGARPPRTQSRGRRGDEPTTRIAVVPQFCSWSAWRMNSTSSACASTGSAS